MNFVNVTASGEQLTMGQSKLNLAGAPARAAAARPAGSSLTVGFRPEHLELANGASDGSVRFPATVDVVEFLGNDELIHATAEGTDIVALLPADRRVTMGTQVDFTVPIEHLYLFDPDSGMALVS